MIGLFDIDNGKIKPTVHCYSVVPLKKIMDEYKKEYLNIYAYLFYMSCYNEDLNPFVNTPESEKEDIVVKNVGGTFDPDDKLIQEALKLCQKLYETTTYNLYISLKTAIENLAYYARTTQINGDGRDSNLGNMIKTLEKFNDIRQSFNSTYKDFKEEQNMKTRGGQNTAYDQ